METVVSPTLSRGLSPEDLIKQYFFEGASRSGPAGASPSRPAGASPSRPAGASRSGPAGVSPSRPAGASPSRPAGAYNISLVSSSNLHERIAILYIFLLPIHSDVLTNSTLIIYILQNLSLCLMISVISLMVLHHNYIIINFLLIILSILVTHRYITEKTLTQSIIIILV